MPFMFSSFQGNDGQIIVPAIGAVAGTARTWRLRREENGPHAGRYSLHVVLSYKNNPLMAASDFRKEAKVLIRRDRRAGKEEWARIYNADLVEVDDMQVRFYGCDVEIVK